MFAGIILLVISVAAIILGRLETSINNKLAAALSANPSKSALNLRVKKFKDRWDSLTCLYGLIALVIGLPAACYLIYTNTAVPLNTFLGWYKYLAIWAVAMLHLAYYHRTNLRDAYERHCSMRDVGSAEEATIVPLCFRVWKFDLAFHCVMLIAGLGLTFTSWYYV